MIGFIICSLIFLTCLFTLGNGRSLHRPNGYMPRGGWGPRPKKFYANGYVMKKHGQQVMVTSIADFLEGKEGKVQYYNEITDEYQDTDPTKE